MMRSSEKNSVKGDNMVETVDDIIETLKFLNSKLEEVNKKKKEIEDRKFAVWAARIVGSFFVIVALSSLAEDPNSITLLLIFLPITI